MDLSIIIVSYNTSGMLRDCLLSLQDATKGLVTETFVVDNCSPDDSVEMVATNFPDVHLIANKENAGFTKANNQALRICSGRNALLLNPDTEAKPDSLACMVRYLDEHPEVGCIGPKLLNTDGTLQKNGTRFPVPWREFFAITGLRHLNSKAFERACWGREDFDSTAEVDSVSGACIMVRSSVLNKIGLLDEDFFMFYEEVELCWRIHRAGNKIVYLAESEVIHHWMGSVRQNSKAMTARLMKSSLIYYRKTGGPISLVSIWIIMRIGLAKNSFIHTGVAVKRWLKKVVGSSG